MKKNRGLMSRSLPARGVITGGTAALLAAFSTARCRGSEALALLLAQQGNMTVTKDSGKNYIVEILVTVALFGAALWVVCRSSRRV